MAATFEQIDWYDTPQYYDIVFAADTVLECDFLQQMGERYGRTRGKRVLEPACGSGRLVEEMARRGHTVTGFDNNPRMLSYTRARLARAGLTARLCRRELDGFRFPRRFDMAHCLVSTFKYLLTEQAARDHLWCTAQALKPGGLYVLGFHLSEYGSASKSRERWVERRGTTTVTCNTQFWPPDRRRRIERVRTRLTVQERARVGRYETHWQFRTYNAEQVRRMLAAVPEFDHVATYDFSYQAASPRDLDDDRLDTVLILRRR